MNMEITVELPDGTEKTFTGATQEEVEFAMDEYLSQEFPEGWEDDRL